MLATFFFPPLGVDKRTMDEIRAINSFIKTVNANNGNGTVAFHMFMFFKHKQETIQKRELYRDDVHWNLTGRRLGEAKLKEWIEVRRGLARKVARAEGDEGMELERELTEEWIKREREKIVKGDVEAYRREREERRDKEIERLEQEGQRRIQEERRRRDRREMSGVSGVQNVLEIQLGRGRRNVVNSDDARDARQEIEWRRSQTRLTARRW